MCSIIGALICGLSTNGLKLANEDLFTLCDVSKQRGRDGFGYTIHAMNSSFDPISYSVRYNKNEIMQSQKYLVRDFYAGTFIGNTRAEPTTEYVAKKTHNDQQPYKCGGWSIVHNGTIANDKLLRTGEIPTSIDSAAIAELLNGMEVGSDSSTRADLFLSAVQKLKGSYAILAVHEEEPLVIYAASNYKPIWYMENEYGFYFGSSRDFFDEDSNLKMVDPYSVMVFSIHHTDKDDRIVISIALPRTESKKALVVCSGGMDSVVAAVYAQKELGLDVELLHFLYGSRAEAPEVVAVQNVAHKMKVPLHLFPLPVYKKSDSPLLDPDSKVAGGEAGAEFAHEWVPARNLLLLSVATAYAEANGFTIIVLGNNLEEAGAYPDNEPEFIARFNDLLPFAVGDGKGMKVIMPVGNMMKHEIVELGMRIGAPLDLTWSCYRAGINHCGTCGPCFMRRTAFKINNIEEVLEYELPAQIS